MVNPFRNKAACFRDGRLRVMDAVKRGACGKSLHVRLTDLTQFLIGCYDGTFAFPANPAGFDAHF